MSEKRKDSKGRILRNGEVQRADGKYMFRYVDVSGKRKSVYSWKLVDTDPVPSGKKCSESLRSIEKRVLKDVDDGIISDLSDRTTIDQMFDSFIRMRTDLRESTRMNYIFQYNTHIKGTFGSRKVSAITYSDVYKLYLSLHTEKGLMVSSIRQINGVLWQVFEVARKDRMIRHNPADDVMLEIARRVKQESVRRHALTIEEQSALLDYVYSSARFEQYRPLITTLLGTGLRIGEAIGLRWEDVDFDGGFISVNHSLLYRSTEDGKYRFRISSTKTTAGTRFIPLLSDVRAALEHEKQRQEFMDNIPAEIDGYSGFVFINQRGTPYSPAYVNDVLNSIVTGYNNVEQAKASRERREPLLLPKISPHILRHTFCTRLCENEQNLKVIQEVMGHKNIATTMDIYSEATKSAKRVCFDKLDGKIKLACNM